jgi:hypothetical protein
MSLIDNKLGGTTPLDVIIDAPADEVIEVEDLSEIIDITANSYWFNRDGLHEVTRIHQYLDQLPETGKVLSVHTAMKMLESLNNDKPYNDFKLAVVYRRLPDDVKDTLISPYMSKDGNQLRFSIRLYESNKSLRRQELLDKIYFDLIDNFNLDPEQVTISGVAVAAKPLQITDPDPRRRLCRHPDDVHPALRLGAPGSGRDYTEYHRRRADTRFDGLDRYPAGYHDDNYRGHRDRYRGGRFDPLCAPISRRVSAGSQSLGRYQTLSQQHCARNVLHLGNRGAGILDSGAFQFHPDHLFRLAERTGDDDRTAGQSRTITDPDRALSVELSRSRG